MYLKMYVNDILEGKFKEENVTPWLRLNGNAQGYVVWSVCVCA